ncbi:MAG: hypothetical protein Q9179_007892, partial [Wetmoreana sp. 5 TL-2023]
NIARPYSRTSGGSAPPMLERNSTLNETVKTDAFTNSNAVDCTYQEALLWPPQGMGKMGDS